MPAVCTGALRQSDWGMSFRKPTRLLARLPGVENILSTGWPTFDADYVYTGPLAPALGPSTTLIGKVKGGFRTTASAAWPPLLCERLAALVFQAFVSPSSARPLAKGGDEGKEEERPIEVEIKDDIKERGDVDLKGPKTLAHHLVRTSRAPLSQDLARERPIEVEIKDDIKALGDVDLKVPKRRRVTREELDKLARGEPLEPNTVYIGRGGRGVPGSPWGNPFKVGQGRSTQAAISEFKGYLRESGLMEEIGTLVGYDLLCHCGEAEPCHGDVLLEAAAAFGARSMATFIDDGLPTRLPVPESLPPTSGGALEGWRGRGAPRTSQHISGPKAFCDGGGLCSPGRWPPGRRRLPGGPSEGLRRCMLESFKEAVNAASGGADDELGFMLKLAAGRFKASPFDDGVLKGLRAKIMSTIDFKPENDKVAEGQVFHLDLLSAVLKALGDPDWGFVSGIGVGVNLGVDSPLPRTPAVFEEKVRWRLSDDVGPGENTNDNYQSVAPHLDAVRRLFLEEERLGWMVELSEEDARKQYGDKLFIAALGVVEEKDKIRVVHDGSNKVHVNHRIKVLDQVRCPGAGELRAILRERAEAGRRSFAILGDVSKAHRRIKVQESDWGYQACQIDAGKVWLNKVGTYGMNPAAYWWGRLAAAVIVRLPYYLAGKDSLMEFLLYVDDWLILATGKEEIILAGAILHLLSALGVPWRWDKCRGGTQVEWIGYWADLWEGRLGLSVRRATWLAVWMRTQVREGTVDMKDFTAVLGRLCFAMGPLEYLRPFISPLFAWAAAVGAHGRAQVPWSVAFLFEFLSLELEGEGRVQPIRPIANDLGLAFRADAKAEGQLVRVGGWECMGGTVPREARWFSVELTRSSAPWAFSKGEPFRTIASLELFATLLCVVLFGGSWPTGAAGAVRLQGLTDNLGNTFALTRLMSSKFPLVVIMAELAAQMQARAMTLNLEWAPRDQNEEADALTNGDFSLFDTKKRVVVDLEEIRWLVLPRMLVVAEGIYEAVQGRKAGRAPARLEEPRPRAKAKLRQREPW
jgi:hypothetical protein